MFCNILFSFFYFATIVFSLQIQYIKQSDISRNKEVVNITNFDINEEIAKEKVWWLIIEKQKSFHIESIYNLPYLAHVEIYDIGLEFMPVFMNLSQIHSIKIKGNDITYLKKESLNTISLSEAFLSSNKISKIERRSFGPQLRVLHLACNQLTIFFEEWFKNPEILEELDISGNGLTYLQENLFKNFKNLDTIILSHNKISGIGNGALSNRISFNNLYFDHNRIHELSEKVFNDSIIKVTKLKIEYNRISFLSEVFLKKVNKTKVSIYGNPWKCECYSSVKKWSEEEDVQYNYYYDYDYSDYEYQYSSVIKVKKTPKEHKKCEEMKDEIAEKKCDYKVDFDHIEEYEKNVTKRATTEDFCKKLLKE